MYDYESLDLFECDDIYALHAVATVCCGDTNTAQEIDE